MAKEHPNFYENLKEAEMRLRGTVVTYDGEPYYVLCITDHKPDGIFRVYLQPLGWRPGPNINLNMPYEFNEDGLPTGLAMDKWLEKYPDSGILRKHMNSPAFNKFRPFPLGMCNYPHGAAYLERVPQRHTQQGLTAAMVMQEYLELDNDGKDGKPKKGSRFFEITSPAFRECIRGRYPSLETCLTKLNDPKIRNKSAAFHRDFALIRGPVETLFFAYKKETIGFLPRNDLSLLQVSKKFVHLKEVLEELKSFEDVTFK